MQKKKNDLCITDGNKIGVCINWARAVTIAVTDTKSWADARTLLRAKASIKTPTIAPPSTISIGPRSAYSSTGDVNVIYLPAISVGAGSVNPAVSRT